MGKAWGWVSRKDQWRKGGTQPSSSGLARSLVFQNVTVTLSAACGGVSAVQALERRRQEASLGYIVKTCFKTEQKANNNMSQLSAGAPLLTLLWLAALRAGKIIVNACSQG